MLTFHLEEFPNGFPDADYEHQLPSSSVKILAATDNIVVGYADVDLFEKFLNIRWIEVAPSHRRQGIGTSILAELIRLFPLLEVKTDGLTETGQLFWTSESILKLI